MIEILEDFKEESKKLVVEMLDILNEVEGDPTQASRLEEFGQKVDRIMGAAQSLCMQLPAGHFLNKISDYSAICKAVGYKSAQIHDNPDFYNVCVAFLLDGTEMLEKMLEHLGAEKNMDLGKLLTQTFLDRLTWVSRQFKADVRATVGFSPSSDKKNDSIDDLLKKLL